MIAIINYKAGDITPIKASLDRLGITSEITDNPYRIDAAHGLILPGKGSFADAVAYMESSGQMSAVRDALLRGVPFLGICLGMQMLFEEGNEPTLHPESTTSQPWNEGLGIFRGYCGKLKPEPHSLPHEGFYEVNYTTAGYSCPLLEHIPSRSEFYYTHSYVVYPTYDHMTMATTVYGQEFPAVIWKDSVFGVQFHPEFSHEVGDKIFANFSRYVDQCG